METQI
jgi:hypothetical protein